MSEVGRKVGNGQSQLEELVTTNTQRDNRLVCRLSDWSLARRVKKSEIANISGTADPAAGHRPMQLRPACSALDLTYAATHDDRVTTPLTVRSVGTSCTAVCLMFRARLHLSDDSTREDAHPFDHYTEHATQFTFWTSCKKLICDETGLPSEYTNSSLHSPSLHPINSRSAYHGANQLHKDRRSSQRLS